MRERFRDVLYLMRWPLIITVLALTGVALWAARDEPATGGQASPKAEDSTLASVSIREGVHYQGKDGPTLNIYRPKKMRGPAPAVIAVHGGTWRHGDGGKMHGFAQRIASRGFVVVKVGYTYANKKQKRGAWPRQFNDIKRGVRWVRDNARRLDIDKRRIGAFGSSSGAHLVALLATKAKRRVSVNAASRVRAAVTWSAFFDFTKMRRHPFFPGIRIFLGCADGGCGKRLRRASPITHVSSDDSAMLIVNARNELMPLSQPRRMAKKMRRHGVSARVKIVRGKKHGAKNADQALPATIRYLREQLGPTAEMGGAR